MNQHRQAVDDLIIALANWRADPSPEATCQVFHRAGCVSGAVLILSAEVEGLRAQVAELERPK